jgi:hypothetical protein
MKGREINMKAALCLLFSVLFLFLIAGCRHTTDKEALVKEGDPGNLLAVELYWKTRTTDEISKRVVTFLQMIAGKSIEHGAVRKTLSDPENIGRWISLLPDEPEIMVKVVEEYDEIRVINPELADTPVKNAIGEKEAIAISAKHIEQMARAGLLNGLNYDTRNSQVGRLVIGEGSLDGKEKSEQVTEYRITVRPDINGIELANAGVRIGVHVSGKLSSIRVGGVSANMKTTKRIVRKVQEEEAEKKFAKLIPAGARPAIAWSRIMYAMPDGVRKALIEPQLIYSYSLQSKSDGVQLVSRRKTVGISLTDPNSRPFDFMPATAKHVESKVSRNKDSETKLNNELNKDSHGKVESE